MKKLFPTLAIAIAATFGSVQSSLAHCGACGVGDEKESAEKKGFPDVTIEELKAMMADTDKALVLIDVNGTESYTEGHIPGAIDFASMSKEELAAALPEDKDTPIVAYCGSSKCSAYKAAAKAAKELGYTHIHHLSAGISGWKEAGEKTEAAKG